jgi:hypothetical protein
MNKVNRFRGMRNWRKIDLPKAIAQVSSIQEVISSKFAIRMGDVFQMFTEMKALIGKIKRRFVFNYRISMLPISKAIGADKF